MILTIDVQDIMMKDKNIYPHGALLVLGGSLVTIYILMLFDRQFQFWRRKNKRNV